MTPEAITILTVLRDRPHGVTAPELLALIEAPDRFNYAINHLRNEGWVCTIPTRLGFVHMLTSAGRRAAG